jgi:hypothetical protein
MTIRITFRVAGKGAQSGVALGGAPAQARGEGGNEHYLQIARGRHPGERSEQERGKSDENGRAETRPATPQRSGHQLRRSDRTEDAAARAADRFVPIADHESNADSGRAGEDERRNERSTGPSEESGQQNADSDAEPRTNPDPVPAPHSP